MATKDTQTTTWIRISVAASITLSIISVAIGWATNNFEWQMPLLNFCLAVTMVAWLATISMAAVASIKRAFAKTLKIQRRQIVADVLASQRSTEAERWIDAVQTAKPHLRSVDR